MEKYYTDERNIQMLIYLLKKNKIRKIVASPGTTNISFVASVQNDSFFEVYSCVDERSAAYIACGLAEESGEPVVLSCTGATASRNYMSGLTEAYYRKIPVLAVTSSQPNVRIGHNIAQVTDRINLPTDIAKLSVQVPIIYSQDDEFACNIAINKAILELKRAGGGPVHINLQTSYSKNFGVKELPNFRAIDRVGYEDEFPTIDKKRTAILIGAHSKFSKKETELIESFCEKYNSVVLCDHTSNYNGKYKILPNILCDQEQYDSEVKNVDLLIHLGNISGAYIRVNPSEVWRVNPDGEMRDTFKKLTCVFEMTEYHFFEKYANDNKKPKKNTEYYEKWRSEIRDLQEKSKQCQLPFSNMWIARKTVDLVPNDATLHLAILNTLRSWNYFENPRIYNGYSNTGGFGIDGIVSSLLGASLNDKNKIIYGIIGDLAFFYDMNTLGNRNFSNNVRLMIINNGCGTEFHNYDNVGASFGTDVDKFIAAGGHFGKKSPSLVKDYCTNCGFEYISASSEEEFMNKINYYVDEKSHDKPLIFEVFTNADDESDALKMMRNLKSDSKGKAKKVVKNILGDKGISIIKNIASK